MLPQVERADWTDRLAATLRKDPAYPKRGTVEDVPRQMMLRGAYPDAYAALIGADLDWLSC